MDVVDIEIEEVGSRLLVLFTYGSCLCGALKLSWMNKEMFREIESGTKCDERRESGGLVLVGPWESPKICWCFVRKSMPFCLGVGIERGHRSPMTQTFDKFDCST